MPVCGNVFKLVALLLPMALSLSPLTPTKALSLSALTPTMALSLSALTPRLLPAFAMLPLAVEAPLTLSA